MSLFSRDHSDIRSNSEGEATEEWTDCHSLFYDRPKLEGSPALGATTWEWPATSPLLFSDSGDCKGKEYVGGWPKREEKEIVDNLAMASPMKELSPNEVFVFNIKYSTTKAQLKAEFSRCGAVASISLPFDKKSSRNKGYAFVTFERDESVERAIVELNGFYLNGRPLGVRRKIESKWPSACSLRSAHTPPATGNPLMFASAAAIRVTATLFLGNIPFEVTRRQIWNPFAAARGKQLLAVRLVKTDLGMPRGFGYVDFFSKAAATKALSLNGHVISGRVLRVNYAEGYQPDFRKRNALRAAASARPLFTDALNDDWEETPPLPTAGIRPIGGQRVCYFPFVQVPRGGYALVPIRALSGLPVAARRASPHMFLSATDWPPPVLDMLPTDVSAVHYCARQPLAPLQSANACHYHSNHPCAGGWRVGASVPPHMSQF